MPLEYIYAQRDEGLCPGLVPHAFKMLGAVLWGPFLGWVLGAMIWDVNEACVPETIYDIKWIPLQCFKYFNDYFYEGINCYLFIFEMFLRNVTLRCMWKLWFIYEIFTLGKRGVTICLPTKRGTMWYF